MKEPQTGRIDPIPSLTAYITEINQLEPSKQRLAVAALLALKTRRLRLLKSTDDGFSVLAAATMVPDVDIKEFCAKLLNNTDFPTTFLSNLTALTNHEKAEKTLAPVASIDLIVNDSGYVSVNTRKALILEGEDLTTLQRQVSKPLVTIHPSETRDGTFLSASEAAKLLGVAKSTITRRIEKNEVLGFRMFTNALRIPAEQFVDGSVVLGIPKVLEVFKKETINGKRYTDHRGAWYFLNTVVYPGDTAPRPIDRLKEAKTVQATEEVFAELCRVKESLDRGDHI